MNTPKRVSFGSTHGSMVETLIIDDMPNEEKAFYQENIIQRNYTDNPAGNQKDCGMNSPPEIHVSFANNNNLEDICTTTTETHTTVIEDLKDSSFEDDPHKAENGTTTTTTTTTTTHTTTINEHDSSLQSLSSPSPDNDTSSYANDSSTVAPSTVPLSPSSQSGSSTPKQPGRPIIRVHRTQSTDSHENPFLADGELSQKAEYILRHSLISRTEIRISDPDLSKLDQTDGPAEESPLMKEETVPTQSARRPDDDKLKENGKVEQPLTPKAVQVEVATANASQPQPQQAEQVKLKEPKCKCCVIM